MNIDRLIADAEDANDPRPLVDASKAMLKEGPEAPTPFAPALSLAPDADAETVEAFSTFGAVVDLANRLSRAARRIAFNRKVASGFSGQRIVSEGDSWFQYPVVLQDIIDQLMEDPDKAILSLGAAGAELRDMADDAEFLGALSQSGAEVLLLSAGGNDLLGEGRLAEVLVPFAPGAGASDLINEQALNARFEQVERDYRRILIAASEARPGIRIFGHGYDLPVPEQNGRWLGGPLQEKGIALSLGREALNLILDRFNGLLGGLDAEFSFFEHVDVRGLVGASRNSWHDEMHPKNSGFERLANAFRGKLAQDPVSVFAAAASAVDLRTIPAATPSSFVSEREGAAERGVDAVAFSSFSERRKMAEAILTFEARRDRNGHLEVYRLPPGDGGGRYEVAGINERYHKDEADHLVSLIEAGRHDEAEAFATEFIANYTDAVDRWCATSAVESYLRDCFFNRGPGGAAWIVQKAVNVVTDRAVGPITRGAIRAAENDPEALLTRLRETREIYERQIVGRNESSRFWRGLVNRWDNALDVARGFLTRAAPRTVDALPAAIAHVVPRTETRDVSVKPMTADEMKNGLADFVAIKSALKGRLGFAQTENLVRSHSATETLNWQSPTPDPAFNVLGVGVGEKISNGAPTGVMSVKVYVRRKFPLADMPLGHRLQQDFDGIPIDVEEIGSITAQRMPNPRRAFATPPPGCSIGFDARMAGTFGARVLDRQGRQLILSNNHVLAGEGLLPVGSPILQQARLDLGPGEPATQVARLDRYLPLAAHDLDVALAEPLPGFAITNRVLHIGAPRGSLAARQSMDVHKYGRTTSYTVGTVADLFVDINVDFHTGRRFFNDQIRVAGRNGRRFSDEGDSGSLVLERGSNAAVGLLFAGSPSATFIHPIANVLSVLDVQLG